MSTIRAKSDQDNKYLTMYRKVHDRLLALHRELTFLQPDSSNLDPIVKMRLEKIWRSIQDNYRDIQCIQKNIEDCAKKNVS
jgi:hypothetical protein